MRILHIITRLDRGGSSDIAMLGVKEMSQRGHDVFLISGYTKEADSIKLKGFIPEEKLTFIEELIRDINPVTDLIAFLKIYSLINKIKPELIHTHSSKAGFLGRWAAWLCNFKSKFTKEKLKIKVVHMPHGHILYGYFDPLFSYVIRILEKLTTFVTDKIITLTTLESDEYVSLGVAPKEKLITIHDGIDFEIYNAKGNIEPPKDILPFDGLTIICVSRLEPVKGQRYLLEAMPFVRHNMPNTRLLLVGDGDERKKLERQCYLLNIKKNVFFLGERNDIPSLLSISDLFVLPSLNEGLGVVLIEAQAMGIPIVATKVGGIPEVVKDSETGLLVPPGNPKALAYSILKILTKTDLKNKMSKAAINWVREPVDGKPRFGMERMFDKIEKLYIETLNKGQ